jgi:hypothetical protein
VKRCVFLADRERRRRRLRMAAIAAAVLGLGGVAAGVVDNSVNREAARIVAERPAVCPYYDEGEPLVSSTRYADGSLICRYNVARGVLRERLNRPNPRRTTL